MTANANAGLDWPVRLLVFENDKGEAARANGGLAEARCRQVGARSLEAAHVSVTGCYGGKVMMPRQKTPIGPCKPLPRSDRDRRMAMSMDQSFQNPSKCRNGVSSKTDRRLPDSR